MSNYSKTRYNKTREYWMNIKRSKNLTDSPSWYEDLERRYIEIARKKNAIEDELSNIRDELFSRMKDDHIDKIVTKLTEVYVIHSFDSRKIDSKRLKNELPEIFAKYSEPYTTNEHLQVAINKSKKLND